MPIETPVDPRSHVVFVASNEPWGKQWFLKHHYANELAALGFEVFFLNPVSRWRASRALARSVRISSVRPRLSVVEYSNPLPVRVARGVAQKINDWRALTRLRPLAKGKQIVLWQFDPFRFAHNYLGAQCRKVYHVADPYEGLLFDKTSAATADLIVCTSNAFLPRYAMFGKRVLYLPHAISSHDCEPDPEGSRSLKARFGRYILHAGSMTDLLDFEIFREICRRFPEHRLVLVGPEHPLSAQNAAILRDCRAEPNFVYEGIVDAAQLRAYVGGAEVGIVAYTFPRQHDAIPNSSSLKVLHYLGQRKPVVSSINIEDLALRGSAVYCAQNLGEYMGVLRDILEGRKTVDREEIDTFLSDRSYSQAIARVFEALQFKNLA